MLTDKNIKEALRGSIAGLDIEKGIAQYNGDENAYSKVLKSYSSSVRLHLKEMENVAEDELIQYRMNIHNIKGASASIFAYGLAKIAADLEEAANKNDLSFVAERNHIFVKAAYELIDAIDKFVVISDNEVGKAIKDKPDTEMLSKLLDVCRKYNMNEVDEIMDKICKYEYESDDGLVAWLKNKTDLMSYSQVVEKLEELLEG